MDDSVSDDLIDVRLIGVPVAVHHAAAMHMRALQREFDLIRQGDPGARSVPHDLLDLIAKLTDEFGGVAEQPVEELENAVDRGDATIDLSYRVPASAGAAARHLGELLDEADDYCRRGAHLLTLVTPPEALRYRRWFLSEFVDQTRGLPPVPWPDYDGADLEEPAVATVAPEPGGPLDLPAGWAVADDGDSATLTTSGPLDILTAPVLRDALASVVTSNRVVTVDLTACDFLDSIGLGVLMAAHLRALEHDVELSFRLSEPARRVITISGLADRLSIEN